MKNKAVTFLLSGVFLLLLLFTTWAQTTQWIFFTIAILAGICYFMAFVYSIQQLRNKVNSKTINLIVLIVSLLLFFCIGYLLLYTYNLNSSFSKLKSVDFLAISILVLD